VCESADNLDKFKQLVYFKYIFIVGFSELNTAIMHKFLTAVVNEQMKPFALFFIKEIT
jgi:hypothetical protein